MLPGSLQDASKGPPRRLQDASRCFREASRTAGLETKQGFRDSELEAAAKQLETKQDFRDSEREGAAK